MKLVADLVSLSVMARRNGLLSLIQVAEQRSSFLLSKGLQLVVDGVNPQVVRDIMENYIISGDYAGKDLLERCIILEGVTAIQQGFHPKVTKEFLLSFLGEDNYAKYQKEYEGGSQDSLELYLKEIEDTPAASSKGSKLDQFILRINDDAVERFLMEINTTDLAKAMVGTGFACLRDNLKENNLDSFCRIAQRTMDQRRFGSAALDCCMVGDGQLDAFWEQQLNLYDVAAGALIAAEAGATVTDFLGKPGLNPKAVLITNGRILAELLELM